MWVSVLLMHDLLAKHTTNSMEDALVLKVHFLENRVWIPGLCIKVMHTATAIYCKVSSTVV